jgi:uncharacterized membrane protein
MNLCQYKDIFGKPGEGNHSYRLFNIAIIDLILTLIGGYLISYYYNYSLLIVLIIIFLIAIILHRLFCVRTTIDRLLFPNADE